jgi:hypothetical protein
MTHIHWVARQNKLETPKEKDEVNKREVHECDVRTAIQTRWSLFIMNDKVKDSLFIMNR